MMQVGIVENLARLEGEGRRKTFKRIIQGHAPGALLII
jgi:hypothetical protein